MHDIVQEPCKRCGKSPRYNYDGYCMDCADLLGVSELFTKGMTEEDKQRLIGLMKENYGTDITNAMVDKLKLTPLRQWAYEFMEEYQGDSAATQQDKLTVVEATATIMGAKEFNVRDGEKVIDLLMYSQNKIFTRPLPFWNIFLNMRLEFGNTIVMGVCLSAIDLVDGKEAFNKNPNWNTAKIKVYANVLQKNNKDFSVYWINYNLGDYSPFENGLKNCGHVHKGATCFEELARKIDLFVCNFLDFIYQPEISMFECHTDPKQNEKREKRGKFPHAEIKNYVVIDHFLKKYPKIFSDEIRGIQQYSHRFWVRGHFRSFRSPRYKGSRGKRIWIAPFTKGQGLLVEKEYILKDKLQMHYSEDTKIEEVES